MNVIKCPQCGLVNFATAVECKRCRFEFTSGRAGEEPEADSGTGKLSDASSPATQNSSRLHEESPQAGGWSTAPSPKLKHSASSPPLLEADKVSYGPWLTLTLHLHLH